MLHLFFFNDTATTEIYTRSLVGSVSVYKRQEGNAVAGRRHDDAGADAVVTRMADDIRREPTLDAVSYTHLRAHETVLDLVCRLLLEKKKGTIRTL